MLVGDTLRILSRTVVSHGAAVFCVVIFVDGEKAIGFERTDKALCHQALVLVHRGWIGCDLLNASTYVFVGGSHSWNAVPYLLEILQWIYQSFGMRLRQIEVRCGERGRGVCNSSENVVRSSCLGIAHGCPAWEIIYGRKQTCRAVLRSIVCHRAIPRDTKWWFWLLSEAVLERV